MRTIIAGSRSFVEQPVMFMTDPIKFDNNPYMINRADRINSVFTKNKQQVFSEYRPYSLFRIYDVRFERVYSPYENASLYPIQLKDVALSAIIIDDCMLPKIATQTVTHLALETGVPYSYSSQLIEQIPELNYEIS